MFSMFHFYYYKIENEFWHLNNGLMQNKGYCLVLVAEVFYLGTTPAMKSDKSGPSKVFSPNLELALFDIECDAFVKIGLA